jgi:hypothetical protein
VLTSQKRVIEFKVHFSQWPDIEKWMRREELYHVQHLLDEFVANKKYDGSLPTIDTCDILIGGTTGGPYLIESIC